MSSTLDIMFDGHVDIAQSFEVLSILEVCVFEIDPVVFRRNINSFLPLAARLMQFAQEIVPATRLVKFFRVVNHV